jgi:hypothetical protein
MAAFVRAASAMLLLGALGLASLRRLGPRGECPLWVLESSSPGSEGSLPCPIFIGSLRASCVVLTLEYRGVAFAPVNIGLLGVVSLNRVCLLYGDNLSNRSAALMPALISVMTQALAVRAILAS